MNKQEETIKKLESIKAIGNDAIAACYNESMNAGITLMKKLDEPQKHVMPKFFDKWAKQVLEKRDKFYAISLIARAGWGYGVDYELDNGRAPSGTKELLYWIVENEGDDYPNKKKAVEALLHGYEVEKEPLYSVIIAGEYLVKEISCSNEVKLVSTAYLPQYLAHHYQLTEKQIKAIDERYWPFAVPVEEVAEG
ncbi:DUF1642 domain-containing protein [Enterococcus faecium]|uniref:DUF1642 domain-containing protein n=1 Tax=Enterococcus faecium TaxID=1352 RepID=UPI000933EF10|nr:DUF1642 domain-containing protein [Enterococcus faecium]PHL12228.1 DUF1642 domain-containing protein [Enterococcus faecium]